VTRSHSHRQKNHSNHDRKHAEGILVLESAHHLINVIDIFLFHGGNQFPNHHAGHALDDEAKVVIGADKIERDHKNNDYFERFDSGEARLQKSGRVEK